jgi:hypothetical protein
MIFFKNKEDSKKFLRLNSSLDIKTFFNMIKNINASDSIMYNMTENEAAFLHSTIPESFDHYFHHLGKFYGFDLGAGIISKLSEAPKNEELKIFDFDRYSITRLNNKLKLVEQELENIYKEYEKESVYNKLNYTYVETIEKPNEKYSRHFALTKEDDDKIFAWQEEHNKKYHKRGFGYQGASPVSNFEIVFGSCSIGDWCDCVCTKCQETAKTLVETNPRKAAKIEKQSKFKVFTIDER